MAGQCHLCKEEKELTEFQKMLVCAECKKAGESFLNDCGADEYFAAEEEYDILTMTREEE